MASGIGGFAGSSGSRRKSRPYRKHRPLPALIVLCVLTLGAVVVWVNVAVDKNNVADEIRCTPEPTPPEGVELTPLPRDALDEVTPTPPGKIQVTVLNAGGRRGQATATTRSLTEFGFTNTGKPANDPAYPDGEADCHGQIRFGQNGKAAARTVSLLDPCLQLVRDNRADAGVDLVIGTEFGQVRPQRAALDILQRLRTLAGERAGDTAGGEQAATGARPPIDPELMRKARTASC